MIPLDMFTRNCAKKTAMNFSKNCSEIFSKISEMFKLFNNSKNSCGNSIITVTSI